MTSVDGKHVLLLASAQPDDRKTLAVIHSLARAGYRLTLAGDSFNSGVFHSRFCRNRLKVPDLFQDSDSCVIALSEALQNGACDTLIPTDDYGTFWLSRQQHKFPQNNRLPVPPAASAVIAKDKRKTERVAKQLGLDIPETHCPADPDEMAKLAGNISYPCVLKPRITVGSVGMSIVNDRDELLAAYDGLPPVVSRGYDFRKPLVQRKIEGEVHEVCALFCKGQPRAAMTQRRLLMYPASGGAGIYNESTDEPELKALAFRLLEALEWHGPAQVEFIRNEADGKPLLLEINGRYWGTLELAIAAGMDFPALTARMAIEGDIEPQWTYRLGLRFRWPYPFALLHALETRDWRGMVRNFLLPARNVRSGVHWTDPKPMLIEIGHMLGRMKKNRFRTIRSTQSWTDITDGQP